MIYFIMVLVSLLSSIESGFCGLGVSLVVINGTNEEIFLQNTSMSCMSVALPKNIKIPPKQRSEIYLEGRNSLLCYKHWGKQQIVIGIGQKQEIGNFSLNVQSGYSGNGGYAYIDDIKNKRGYYLATYPAEKMIETWSTISATVIIAHEHVN
ncbi:MAG: hypothetical protein HQK53_10680 [Oligoflexia bacterium]|nr:hypothetical protein [Oligoflexia bacterium]